MKRGTNEEREREGLTSQMRDDGRELVGTTDTLQDMRMLIFTCAYVLALMIPCIHLYIQ